MKYTGEYTKEILFPLGGIGTGSIGLGGDGRLLDWEIFNRPSKGSFNGHSHFAVRAIDGDKIIPMILNGDFMGNATGQYGLGLYGGYGNGPTMEKMIGFPHFEHLEFNGEFPIAKLSFSDEKFPGKITMTAFNPFIPKDEFNSSIPGAFFEFEIENTASQDLLYELAFTVANPYEKSVNTSEKVNGLTVLNLFNSGAAKNELDYGELSVATDCDKAFVQSHWYRGSWNNNVITFWNEFSKETQIKNRSYDTEGKKDTGTVYAQKKISCGKSEKVRFVLTWNVPNTNNYLTEDNSLKTPWKNYYATVFESSLHSAKYSLENFDELLKRTLVFKNALHSTSLPSEVIDAASANISVLKTATVQRLENGSFYGWEGCFEKVGSCYGTCQHVWNYAYAMCFLFPNLERSIRDNEFKYCTAPDGKMGFRIVLPLGSGVNPFRACTDGQMGAVIKCYREWKLSGDNEWLKETWGNIKKVLEYAWSKDNPDLWDFDKDGVLEGRQHHTLDMELFGPSSWLEGMYLLALKCASEMAEFLDEKEKSKEYLQLFEKGKKWTKENLFNGKYFIHKVDLTNKAEVDKYGAEEDYWNFEANEIKYQIANGSSIDQILAQWHSDILGVGEIFDKDQLLTALDSMMKYNFKQNMRSFVNPWRIFAMNDESGSVMCDYPDDAEKPKIPICYSEETMTGFEYSFAGVLCTNGKIEEGLKVVKAVRDRFDGKKRNPWNEFECGSNYARSMASYALIPILSGFEFDMPKGHIGFKPYKDGDFSSIWSVANAWGNFEIKGCNVNLSVFENPITLKSFGVKFTDTVNNVKIDGKDIDFEFKNGIIYFKETKISKSLEINL